MRRGLVCYLERVSWQFKWHAVMSCRLLQLLNTLSHKHLSTDPEMSWGKLHIRFLVPVRYLYELDMCFN